MVRDWAIQLSLQGYKGFAKRKDEYVFLQEDGEEERVWPFFLCEWVCDPFV